MSKTAREGLEYVLECVEAGGMALMMVPLMLQYLTQHFDAGRAFDDPLEMG